jgi:acyl-CoA thioesterase I
VLLLSLACMFAHENWGAPGSRDNSAVALRARMGRVLLLAVLSLSAVIGSIVVSQAGISSTRPQPGPGRRAAAALTGQPRSGATQCLVTPRPSAGPARPLLVVLGASFTAGVGADSPSQSWAIRLAELIRWRALTIGVPGAGYAEPGAEGLGPVAREVIRAHLASLRPSLIIIQAGHDDLRISPPAEQATVARLVKGLRADVPGARLAFLTVFSAPNAPPSMVNKERSTDSAIVVAIRKADAGALVLDPLRWRFPRNDGGTGLHPSSRGHLVLAERVARALVRAGLVPATARTPQPATVTCTSLHQAAQLSSAGAVG